MYLTITLNNSYKWVENTSINECRICEKDWRKKNL